MDGLYLWIEALHVAAAMVFAGGVMVTAVALPLLKAGSSVHGGAVAPSGNGGAVAAGLRRWGRLVTTPAMLLVWGFGIYLAVRGHWFAAHWMSAKLVVVLALSALHGLQVGGLRRLAGGSVAGVRAPGWAAAAVVLGVVVISVLVVVKPF